MSRIVIFANGALSDPERVRSLLLPQDVILCADGGTRHALALGLMPDLIIGDLDSMRPEDREAVRSRAIRIMEYPHDKNETDLELALNEALIRKPTAILIIAALGKRLDHTLGNISMLSDPALANVDVRLDDGLEEVFFCRSTAQIRGTAGDIVSLLPWGAAVLGIRTQGLRWPLEDETLRPEKTRGVSNEMLGPSATVTITSGLLLLVHRRQSQAENRSL